VRLVLASCVALAALSASGCGTESVEGDVGDQLEAGSIRATASRVSSEVPSPRNDVTGLGSARPGNRLIGVHVKMCKSSGQAVNDSAFTLELEGGDSADHKFPQTAYPDGFDSLRSGCESGWLVFEAPRGARPSALAFEYEDTGQGGPSGNDGEHVKLKWKVARDG
jgi:hypothetical protein